MRSSLQTAAPAASRSYHGVVSASQEENLKDAWWPWMSFVHGFQLGVLLGY